MLQYVKEDLFIFYVVSPCVKMDQPSWPSVYGTYDLEEAGEPADLDGEEDLDECGEQVVHASCSTLQYYVMHLGMRIQISR